MKVLLDLVMLLRNNTALGYFGTKIASFIVLNFAGSDFSVIVKISLTFMLSQELENLIWKGKNSGVTVICYIEAFCTLTLYIC